MFDIKSHIILIDGYTRMERLDFELFLRSYGFRAQLTIEQMIALRI